MTGRLDRAASATAVLFIASMASFVQSFVLLKLVLLLLFVTMALLSAYQRGTLTVHPRLVAFYLSLATVGAVWSVMSLVRGGGHLTGVTDAVRLYVVWSMAYVVLYTLLRSTRSGGLRELHDAMVLAGLVIPVINLVGLFDSAMQMGLVGNDLRTELDMFIGFGDGYVQITSQNIGALFFVAPYLLALQFRVDAAGLNSRATKLALVLSLVIAALSGRRALWLVIAVTPALVFGLSVLTGGFSHLRRAGQRLLVAYLAAGALMTGVVVATPENTEGLGYLRHLKRAFSAQDERSIQRPYLVEAFKQAPYLGSGFGAPVAYVRTPERPWRYELTYHQLLFNLGIVGVALLVTLFASCALLVRGALSASVYGVAVPFALLVGFTSLLVGAVSNPYTGSFDYLFFVGLLPFLATFTDGYPLMVSRTAVVR